MRGWLAYRESQVQLSLPRARYTLGRARSRLRNAVDRRRDPDAAAFYADLSGGYDPNARIDVLPSHKLIYVCVPKCASTSIKMILSTLAGRQPASFDHIHKRRHSGLLSPLQIGLSAFHRLATDAGVLRFSFVRNPYARLVSAWADKFQGKPLVAGDPFVDRYLADRPAIDPSLPHGENRMLSFTDFIVYAAATARARVDAHWQLQDDIVSMPRLALDFIGKVESFTRDVVRVLDHVDAGAELRQRALIPMHASPHTRWPDYYTAALAERVYGAYEADFDRFGYPRTFLR
jgi:Sulfotransferase family